MISSRSPQHQANYAYAKYSVVEEMAQHHRVYLNPNGVAGLPSDTFRRSHTLTSARYQTPPSQGKVWLKGIGSFISGLASIFGIVGMFVPPVAPIAAIAEPVGSMIGMATDQIDTRPKPVQMQTQRKYNYWFR